MSQKKLFFLALLALGLVISCSKDDGPSTPPNTAPVIKAQTFNAVENISDATIIGTVTATDADKGDKLTFSIATNSGDLFEITNAGALSLAPGKTLDFDTKKQHVLSIGVSDGKATAKADVTIKVTEVVAQNQAPVIEPQGFEAAEDIADTDVIGTVAATDPEQDALTFSISTNDDDIFEIDASSGELSLAEGKALDFETAEGHTITVAVTDGVNDPVSAEITITVTNVYEALAEDPASFITTWVTTVNNETIKIGVDAALTYDYTIDWGDGTVEDITDRSDPQHEYAGPGTYTVAIKGAFPAIRMGNNVNLVQADRDRLASIEQWGTNLWASMYYAFAYCGNMVYNATDVPDLSQVTNMGGMFSGATAFNGDLSGWDVSNVTDMSFMFSGADAFNGDISGWDVSNVTNMPGMFQHASAFNGDISGWDVSSVTDMIYMFYNAVTFNRNLGAWDIGSVIEMDEMLSGSGLSTANYGATILGWATYVQNNNGPSNIPLGASGLYYCSGQQSVVGARTFLTDTHGWYINDEGGTNICN
ncbi:MAG: BspA family leucine-rich repeat surface protein [Allomuricauda sp.]